MSEKRFAELADLDCVITWQARQMALSVVDQLPHLHVGIFPSGEDDDDEGGVNLQIVTESVIAVVHIDSTGAVSHGHYASDTTYYEQEMWGRDDAVRFFSQTDFGPAPRGVDAGPKLRGD